MSCSYLFICKNLKQANIHSTKACLFFICVQLKWKLKLELVKGGVDLSSKWHTAPIYWAQFQFTWPVWVINTDHCILACVLIALAKWDWQWDIILGHCTIDGIASHPIQHPWKTFVEHPCPFHNINYFFFSLSLFKLCTFVDKLSWNVCLNYMTLSPLVKFILHKEKRIFRSICHNFVILIWSCILNKKSLRILD